MIILRHKTLIKKILNLFEEKHLWPFKIEQAQRDILAAISRDKKAKEPLELNNKDNEKIAIGKPVDH